MRMKLDIKRQKNEVFPPLGWVARYRADKDDGATVWCGNLVEVGPDFVVEGVWPGSFAQLGFDESEVFYGSGLRVKDDAIVFVSSCSTVDRLWCHSDNGEVTVSNSLPCLLSMADINLVCDDSRYAQLVETIVKGRDYEKFFPVDRGTLSIHYFENLRLDRSGVKVIEKNNSVSPFNDFSDYSQFLLGTAQGIGANARDPLRANQVGVISTISRGYDSPVASFMARTAGATKAFTIKAARSIIPREDSGAEIAGYLGLECEEYTNSRENIKDELWYWAANGTLQDMNFSIFNYPQGPSVMFTGFNGDMVWSKGNPLTDNYLKRKDSTGLGFCEHRLVKGVIHCPVPFWGIRHVNDLKRISSDGEMASWSVPGDYDRPIPRRIAEEAGVPRELFGQKKSATTVDELLLFPVKRQLMDEYKKYLKVHYVDSSGLYTLSLSRKLIDLWRMVLRQRLMDLLKKTLNISLVTRNYRWEGYLFPWANQSLKPSFRLKEEVENQMD